MRHRFSHDEPLSYAKAGKIIYDQRVIKCKIVTNRLNRKYVKRVLWEKAASACCFKLIANYFADLKVDFKLKPLVLI